MSMHQEEKGFVLATSLVMLLLMTLLTVAVYVSVDSSQKSSMAAESATEAFYYAETAANYMAWALYNNAEFDSYTYPDPVRTDLSGAANHRFGEPETRPGGGLDDSVAAGDFAEWDANRGNPSGEDVFTVSGVDHYGQLMYYDNSTLANRMVWLRNKDMYSEGSSGLPTMHKIHTKLPRYIMLSIDEYGNITPSMPPYSATSPHHGNVMGVDYPENGAIVWLTGGNRTDDHELAPIDNFFAPVFDFTNPLDATTRVNDPYGAYLMPPSGTFPCDVALATSASKACNKPIGTGTGQWLTGTEYGLVIYALGYVRGEAHKLIRVVYK